MEANGYFIRLDQVLFVSEQHIAQANSRSERLAPVLCAPTTCFQQLTALFDSA